MGLVSLVIPMPAPALICAKKSAHYVLDFWVNPKVFSGTI